VEELIRKVGELPERRVILIGVLMSAVVEVDAPDVVEMDLGPLVRWSILLKRIVEAEVELCRSANVWLRRIELHFLVREFR